MIQTTSQLVDLQIAGEALDMDTPTRRLARKLQPLRAVPHLATWIGVLLSAAGAGLLMIAWARTAALTNVGLQIPYVVSAGFTGLGLVAVGLTVVNVSSKREDARERTRQLGELRELLAEMRGTIEADKR